MSITFNAQSLCDELYKSLTGQHGFTMVGDSYGWEPGYMIIDWCTSVGDGAVTIDPDDLESLGEKVQSMANKYGFQLVKLQGGTHGYGDFYFKSIPESNEVDNPF